MGYAIRATLAFMSTKCTRKLDRDQATARGFHLYDEAFDDDHVYLDLEGFEFEACSGAGNQPPRLLVTLPIEWAGKLGLIPPGEKKGEFPAGRLEEL